MGQNQTFVALSVRDHKVVVGHLAQFLRSLLSIVLVHHSLISFAMQSVYGNSKVRSSCIQCTSNARMCWCDAVLRPSRRARVVSSCQGAPHSVGLLQSLVSPGVAFLLGGLSILMEPRLALPCTAMGTRSTLVGLVGLSVWPPLSWLAGRSCRPTPWDPVHTRMYLLRHLFLPSPR